MPIYAYRCSECGHELEVLQKVSDAPLTDCPSCQRPTLAKQVTAAGFQLKGSGWYVTDFRDKAAAKKEAPKSDTPAGTKTESAAETAATKPAEASAAPSPAPAPAPAPSPAAES